MPYLANVALHELGANDADEACIGAVGHGAGTELCNNDELLREEHATSPTVFPVPGGP